MGNAESSSKVPEKSIIKEQKEELMILMILKMLILNQKML